MSLSTKKKWFLFLYPLCVCYASPIFFANHAFPGSNVYTAADIPAIDILIMSHDHWDHLDYPTILSLKDKIRKIVCPLGVGEYFEAWRFAPDQLLDLALLEKFLFLALWNLFRMAPAFLILAWG